MYTDHNPLQWLSAQKMEGKLARWSLSLQEYDFTFKYCRSQNKNADALSRCPVDVVGTVKLQTGIAKFAPIRNKTPLYHRLYTIFL